VLLVGHREFRDMLALPDHSVVIDAAGVLAN
jgi:hypothetical protein